MLAIFSHKLKKYYDTYDGEERGCYDIEDMINNKFGAQNIDKMFPDWNVFSEWCNSLIEDGYIYKPYTKWEEE